MMLRSLVDEVVRRRLWPIPLLALVVAIAAPMLFMKSDAPAVTELPPAPAPTELPITAKKLVSGDDKSAVVIVRPKHKKQDPFAPPASSSTSDSAASASTETAAATDPSQSVPVSIDGSSGSTTSPTTEPTTTSTTTEPTTSSSTASATKPKSSTTTKTKTTKTTKPKVTTSSASANKRVTYVDVRFGKRMGTMLRYRVPRLQTFQAGGRVAAMFVGYAAARNAAVFAIAPSTAVTGVKCRKVKGVCRFIDLPPGAHARITLVGERGVPVHRRLDVASIRHLKLVAGSKSSARMTSLSDARCLFSKLVSLSTTAPSISADACA
jgi:hypothetical protein